VIPAPRKVTVSNTTAQIECTYCNFKAKAIYGLTQHIEHMHSDETTTHNEVRRVTDHHGNDINWTIYQSNHDTTSNCQSDTCSFNDTKEMSEPPSQPTSESDNEAELSSTTSDRAPTKSLQELNPFPYTNMMEFIISVWAFGQYPRISESRFAELIRIIKHPLFDLKQIANNFSKKGSLELLHQSFHFIGKVKSTWL